MNFSYFIILMFFETLYCSYENSTFRPEYPTARINDYIKVIWQNTNEKDIDLKFMIINKSNKTHTLNLYKNIHRNGSVTLKTPSVPGKYTIKYCVNGNYDCPLTTELIVIKCAENKVMSNIKHIITIISENHSFDSIYGNYCTAPINSKPSCNTGRECCEKAPSEIDGFIALNLTNEVNGKFQPCHTFNCDLDHMNGGKMDQFVKGGKYSDPRNFAVGINTTDSVMHYFKWASENAMSDNFFQSAVGESCSNDMYFATGKFVFKNNEYVPQNWDLNGARCYDDRFISYYDATIANLLNTCEIKWTFYAEGFDVNPNYKQCFPNYYDASDNPFTYYPSLTDSPTSKYNFRDLNAFFNDVDKQTLPSIIYIKALGINSEHPDHKDSFTNGQLLSKNITDYIKNSKYANDTIIILLPDESGGFYDHITPPSKSEVDGLNYGPRTHFVIVSEMAKKNYISHVRLEPTSIIKFIEWNWFEGVTGQLDTRDKVVNNIGDLLDSEKTGIKIPDN